MPDPYEIAAWRFEQIAPLIDPSLNAVQRRAALHQRTHEPVTWPGESTRQRPIPKSTLYRWLGAFRRRGYRGLLPKPRADRGRTRRKSTAAWVGYALALLYEQPQRSLTQLDVYLRAEFDDYRLSRSSLARHLRAHSAFSGIEKLRRARPPRLRVLYEAQYPHEGWQLDAKGPFTVRLTDGTRVAVHVLTILDDYSRSVLACVLAPSPSAEAAVRVFEKAVSKWGIADRFQFDLGSAFESDVFRRGIAHLGVHRNATKARSPEQQGKIEAYHRCLARWFVNELPVQEVHDLVHLEQLLEAMVALLYNRHHHRELATTPEKRLANRLSARQISTHALERAFFVETLAKSHPKTGEVRLPNGRFRVPRAFAGHRSRFRHHPVHREHAVLLAHDGRELELAPFTKKPLSALKPRLEPRATGQLQKLLDLWLGHERPNAQPGFGLPELFTALTPLLGRTLPESEREAMTVLAFYRKHGPLPREAFLSACERTRNALGPGRPLSAYLDDLERQVIAQTDSDNPTRDAP